MTIEFLWKILCKLRIDLGYCTLLFVVEARLYGTKVLFYAVTVFNSVYSRGAKVYVCFKHVCLRQHVKGGGEECVREIEEMFIVR